MNKNCKDILNKINKFPSNNVGIYKKYIINKSKYSSVKSDIDDYVFFINKNDEILLALFGTIDLVNNNLLSIEESYLTDFNKENEVTNLYKDLYYADTDQIFNIIEEFDASSLEENHLKGLVKVLDNKLLKDLLLSFDKVISDCNYNNVKETLISSFKNI